MEIIIAEVTRDYNDHFPKPDTGNQIIEVYLNDGLLDLKDAALSLQPGPQENGFHTVVNIHTIDYGD